MSKKDSVLSTNGFKLLILYLLVTYTPGIILYYLFRKQYENLYNGFSQGFYPLLIIPFVVILFLVLNKKIPRFNLVKSLQKISPYGSRFLNIAIISLYVLFSLKFYLDHGLKFRHSGQSLSSVSFYVTIMFFLKQYVRCYILFALLRLIVLNKYKPLFIELVLSIAGTFLSLSAASDIPLLLIPFLLLILPERFLKSLATKRKFDGKNLTSTLFKGFFACLVGLMMVFVGLANKYSSKEVLGVASNPLLQDIIIRSVTTRVSMSLASLMNVGNNYLFDTDVQETSILAPLNNVELRYTNALKVGYKQKSDPWSINRLNYLNTYKSTHQRAGASPGLIASGLYYPYFPFNLVFLAIYIMIVLRPLNALLDGLRLPWITLLALLYFIIPLFQITYERFINFIDPSFLYFVCYYSALHTLYNLRQENKKKSINSINLVKNFSY